MNITTTIQIILSTTREILGILPLGTDYTLKIPPLHCAGIVLFGPHFPTCSGNGTANDMLGKDTHIRLKQILAPFCPGSEHPLWEKSVC